MAAATPPDSMRKRRLALRQQYRRARRALTARQHAEHGNAVAKHWQEVPALATPVGAVALFVSQDGEIDTAPLRAQLQANQRVVALPWIDEKGQMHFREHRPGARLEPGRYDIPVPPADSPPVTLATLAIMVLPLVAYDASGTRLGMGGGYYDRLLGAVPPSKRPLLLGLAHSVQRASTPLPRAAWDVPLDAVLTEAGLARFSGAAALRSP